MKQPVLQEETHLIYSFSRNASEQVQFALRKYKGKQYADIRIWYQPQDDPTLRPTQKGIFMPLESVPEMIKGMEKMARAAEKIRIHEEPPV